MVGLFDHLSIATRTTMIGRTGKIFANHPGSGSSGILVCPGLPCMRFSMLFLMPGPPAWAGGDVSSGENG